MERQTHSLSPRAVKKHAINSHQSGLGVLTGMGEMGGGRLADGEENRGPRGG